MYIFNNLLTFLLCAIEINGIYKCVVCEKQIPLFIQLLRNVLHLHVPLLTCFVCSRDHPVLDENLRIHVSKTIYIFCLNKVMDLSIIIKAIFDNSKICTKFYTIFLLMKLN